MYKIQALASIRQQKALTGKAQGRAWLNVAKPRGSRAVAEQLARFARIDDPDALIRDIR